MAKCQCGAEPKPGSQDPVILNSEVIAMALARTGRRIRAVGGSMALAHTDLASIFCSQSPDSSHYPVYGANTTFNTYLNHLITQKWNQTCQCKQDCFNKKGKCYTDYQVRSYFQHPDGAVYSYGTSGVGPVSIAVSRPFQFRWRDSDYYKILVTATFASRGGVSPFIDNVSMTSINFREENAEKLLSIEIFRSDGQPDDCAPKPPKEPDRDYYPPPPILWLPPPPPPIKEPEKKPIVSYPGFPIGLPRFPGKPAPPKEEEEEMACCDKLLSELKELRKEVKTIKEKLGLDEFPGRVPKSLFGYDDGQQIEVKTLTKWLEWFVQQFDGLIGQFPIEIEVEDIDPSKAGNQTKKIEIPNLAEGLAELYSQCMTSAINSDLAINFLMRVSSEVVGAKNAALIAQDYAKANAQFLGYRGNVVQRKIPYAFNLAELGSFEKLLSESSGTIEGWEEDDPESVVEYFKRLAFAAGIIKAVFMKTPKQMGMLEKELASLLKQGENQSDKDWDEFIRRMEDSDSEFNRYSDITPDLDSKTIPPK